MAGKREGGNMKKIYRVLERRATMYTRFDGISKHQIDQHNNLHLMDDNYEDILVFKADMWEWFKVVEEIE
jgi:hypothetical protein